MRTHVLLSDWRRATFKLNAWNIAEYMRALRCDPCAYCGATAETAIHRMELDHIEPAVYVDGVRAKNTTTAEWENLTSACAACNLEKRRMSLLEFLAWPPGWLGST